MVDPAVCDPRAKDTKLAATAAAEPLDDPPGVRLGSRGFLVGPGRAMPNVVHTVFPRMTPPSSRVRATAHASARGTESPSAESPHRVENSAVVKMSFTPTSAPLSGPEAQPATRAGALCAS